MEQEKQYYACPRNLIFNETDNWELPTSPNIGTVGCFVADRAPPWDLFVIVDFNEETHTLTAICPRIRLTDEKKVQIGQDKITEEFYDDTECVCPPIQQGDDFYCNCGAFEKINENYRNTFVEAPEDTQYKAIKFVHYDFMKFNWIYHEHVKKDVAELKILEYPMQKGSCCRVV